MFNFKNLILDWFCRVGGTKKKKTPGTADWPPTVFAAYAFTFVPFSSFGGGGVETIRFQP